MTTCLQAIVDFTVHDAFVNENATKQQYHWLKEET